MSARRRPAPAEVRAHLDGLAALAGAPAREQYAVSIYGDPAGWLVTAGSASEAAAIVHGTVPAARDVALGELLVWSVSYLVDVRGADLTGWTVLDGAP